MTWEMIELKEGESVVFLAVHALRWRPEWGEPAVGFRQSEVDIEELQAENERLRAALIDLSAHVRFAVLNGDKFAYHDPDYVIDNWLYGAKDMLTKSTTALGYTRPAELDLETNAI